MKKRIYLLKLLALSGGLAGAGCLTNLDDDEAGTPQKPPEFDSCPKSGPVPATGEPWFADQSDSSNPQETNTTNSNSLRESLKEQCRDMYQDKAIDDIQRRFEPSVEMMWGYPVTDSDEPAILVQLLALTDRARTELVERPAVSFGEFQATVPASMTGPVISDGEEYSVTVPFLVDCKYVAEKGD